MFCGVLMQLVASTDHLWTWIDLYSLVDHFTIVPTFVSIYYNTNWIGLLTVYPSYLVTVGGSVAEWLACWTQAQKGPGSNRSRDAVG